MGHSQFNFKSSGFRRDDRRFVAKKTNVRPIGIVTPLKVGDDIFKMNTNPVRQLTDNFRNLLMTNHGERLGMFNFGANLNALLFEYSNSPDFNDVVSEAVIDATNRYIPSIAISTVDLVPIDVNEKNEANRLGLAKVRLRVEYTIPKFNSPKLGLEIDLTVGG